MATFRDMIGIANNPEYRRSVQYYKIKAAVAVMAEDSETANHAARVIAAGNILSGEDGNGEYAVAVATNSTISAKILADQDYSSDLEFVVNSLFDAFAGVST